MLPEDLGERGACQASFLPLRAFCGFFFLTAEDTENAESCFVRVLCGLIVSVVVSASDQVTSKS